MGLGSRWKGRGGRDKKGRVYVFQILIIAIEYTVQA